MAETTLDDAVIRIRLDPKQALAEARKFREQEEKEAESTYTRIHARHAGAAAVAARRAPRFAADHESEVEDDDALIKRLDRVARKLRFAGAGPGAWGAAAGGATMGGALGALGMAAKAGGVAAVAVAAGYAVKEAAMNWGPTATGFMSEATKGMPLLEGMSRTLDDWMKWVSGQVTRIWTTLESGVVAPYKTAQMGTAIMRLGGQAPTAGEEWDTMKKIYKMEQAQSELEAALSRNVSRDFAQNFGKLLNETARRSVFQR